MGAMFTAHRQNVLYLVADDLRPELGTYGTMAKTPHIDLLASEALVFERAYCQQAVCVASRNSFMTGRRPVHTNLGNGATSSFRTDGIDRHGVAGSNWTSLPGHFLVHDYNVQGGGKTYHPGSPPNFDGFRSWSNAETYYGYNYWMPPSITHAAYPGPCPGHAKPNGPPAGPIAVWCALDEEDSHFYDHGLANDTIARLQEAARLYKEMGTNFFIMSGFARPHTPWRVPQRFWDLYNTSEIPVAKHRFLPDGAPGVAWQAHSFFNATTGDAWPLNATLPLSDNIARLARHAYVLIHSIHLSYN